MYADTDCQVQEFAAKRANTGRIEAMSQVGIGSRSAEKFFHACWSLPSAFVTWL